MPDLQALLDQIENSDKYATPGPWESHFGGNVRFYLDEMYPMWVLQN